ncbi:MAG: cyclase family protein [Oscillospiraceae bacterium]|nr:cyclase family protein [Oscillospiraceae bacterium]
MNRAEDAYKALKNLKCYDISPHFHQNMPAYPGSPNMWIVPQVQTIDENGFYSQVLIMGEHVGSHIDAPLHTVKGGKAIDAFPGDYFIAPYKKYGFDRFDPQPGEFMTLKQMHRIEEEDGFKPEAGDVILIQFGWHKHYKPDAPTKAERDWYAVNEPGLADEIMEYLASKKIKAIGFDNSGAEGPFKDGTPLSFTGHTKYFHPNGICIMENFVGDMTPAPCEGLFVAIPLPIGNGSGCPVRPLLFG